VSTFTLSGRVTETSPTASTGIAGATVVFADGVNAGKSATTDGSGNYSLAGLQQGGFTVNVSASGYQGKGNPVSITGNTTANFQLAPNPQTKDETFTGTISGGDAPCAGGDGVFRDKPCRVISLPIHNGGVIDATLDWSPNSVADLDISLFTAGGTNAIVRSASASGGREHISTNVAAGSTYELHVTYYTGSNITTYSVRVIHPN
jgi:hypothetical protein